MTLMIAAHVKECYSENSKGACGFVTLSIGLLLLAPVSAIIARLA